MNNSNLNSTCGSNYEQPATDVKDNDDLFYLTSNNTYLENMLKDIKEGIAHFSEHNLIED